MRVQDQKVSTLEDKNWLGGLLTKYVRGGSDQCFMCRTHAHIAGMGKRQGMDILY